MDAVGRWMGVCRDVSIVMVSQIVERQKLWIAIHNGCARDESLLWKSHVDHMSRDYTSVERIVLCRHIIVIIMGCHVVSLGG